MTRSHAFTLRTLDILVASSALVLLAPALAACALAVRLTSRGPSLFLQERIGRDGRPFWLYKFRSMRSGPGPRITAADDGRITGFGRWLRRRRFDELPQLWNILRGDMSLVGPRPEVAQFVAAYGPYRQSILSVRPGLTDPATLACLNEEEELANREDPEGFYLEHLLPQKLERSATYLERRRLRDDLGVLARTAGALMQRSARRPDDAIDD